MLVGKSRFLFVLKGFIYGCTATVLACGTGLSIIAARHIPTIKSNTFVGVVPVGGLTQEEAAKRIRIWWESEKTKPLTLHAAGIEASLPSETVGQLGVTIDDTGSVAAIPTEDLADDLKGIVSKDQGDKRTFPILFKPNNADLKPLADLIAKSIPKAHPAKVVYQKGEILLTKETTSEELDVAAVPQAAMKVLPDGDSVDLPMKTSPKRIPDEALSQITDLVYEFSTHFPASNYPRCSNIKLASSKLKGVILMPGERMSFNQTVGRRTLKAGFKVAGVYKNGKHDTGIGGGICQVSTTLYNACLLSNLKIRQRSNHSLPVAYVPLGRDATVDYGDLDLVIENNYSTPIAIDSEYHPGKLTFRILGKKDPTLSVKIERTGISSWDPGTQLLVDHSLKPGARHIVEKGSWGHAVTTYRLVYHNGVLTKREYLAHSTYSPEPVVIAYNPQKAVKKAPVVLQQGAPSTPATTGTPSPQP